AARGAGFAFENSGVLPCPVWFYGMRSQHQLVITAALVCHLFLLPQLVTSQAHPEQPAQAPPPAAQPTPPDSATPVEPLVPPASPEQTPAPAAPASGRPQGNCHSVITSPPAQKTAQNGAGTAVSSSAGKENLPVSEEHPVIIDADECEKAGNIYTLRGNIAIHFGDYDFHADAATYDSSTADVSAKGNVSLDGGRRDLHLTAREGTYNTRSHTGKFYNVHGSTGARFKGRSV